MGLSLWQPRTQVVHLPRDSQPQHVSAIQMFTICTPEVLLRRQAEDQHQGQRPAHHSGCDYQTHQRQVFPPLNVKPEPGVDPVPRLPATTSVPRPRRCPHTVRNNHSGPTITHPQRDPAPLFHDPPSPAPHRFLQEPLPLQLQRAAVVGGAMAYDAPVAAQSGDVTSRLAGLSNPRERLTGVWLPRHNTWHIVVTGFSMQCEEFWRRDSSAMMIRISHCDVCVSHGMQDCTSLATHSGQALRSDSINDEN
jgi:hypothetical protein